MISIAFKKKSLVALERMRHPEGCVYVYAPVICIYVCAAAFFLSAAWCSAGHVELTGADQLLFTSYIPSSLCFQSL